MEKRQGCWQQSPASACPLPLKDGQTGSTNRGQSCRRYRKELLDPARIDRRKHAVNNRGGKFTLRLPPKTGQTNEDYPILRWTEDERNWDHYAHQWILSGKV